MDTSKYENKMPYPVKPKKPYLNTKHTSAEAKEYAELLEVYEQEMVDWGEAIRAHHAETGRLETQFREDAIKEVGLEGHPKADKAWSLAWERGHSSGLYSVYQELDELAELLLED